jgi:cell division protein FtsI (penicillin-binding protein 3)
VPDVKGMNVTDAVYVLESMGWKVSFTGYGKVKSQSVKADTELKKGSIINLVISAK